MAIYFQVISTIAIAHICMNMGIMTAWPSSTVLLFKSANTTLNRPMGETEISLFGSLVSVGSLIGIPIVGAVLDKLGRKRTLIFGSLAFVITWSIIAATAHVEAILIAMLIGGSGSTVVLVSTVFISEICQDSIRGAMTAAPIQFYCLGYLVSYLLGGFLEYYAMVYACLSIAVVGILIIGLMKESPISLMRKGHEEEAAKTVAFYRRQKSTSKEVLREIDKIRRILNCEVEDVQSLATMTEANFEPEFKSSKKISSWQFFKNSPSSQRELLVTIFLKFVFVFQGMPVVQVYATPLFVEAVPSDFIPPSMCSILMGVVAFLSGLVASVSTDIFGRRFLLFYASIGAGACCVVIGAQLLTGWGPAWIVPMFIFIYTVFYTLGAGTVPFVILAEVFLPQVKSILSMIVVEWSWVIYFILLFVFRPMVAAVGLGPVFLCFAGVCLGTAVFCHYCLPETKGLPLDAIQEVFTKTR